MEEMLGGTGPFSAYFDVLGFPPTPTNLSAIPTNAQVVVSWSASSTATSYNVKRSTSPSGTYTTIASPTGTSYTNTGLTNGTTYWYKVSAVNAAGQSADAGPVSATPMAPPAAPTGVTATPGNAQVTVTWNASTGAATYKLYRSTTSGSETLLTSGITSTSYINTGLINSTTYYYKVSAVNVGGESALSSEASATPLGPPPSPTLSIQSVGNAQISLSWTTSLNATSYTLKRSTSSSMSSPTTVTQVGTTYSDSGLTNGTTYYYTVYASGVGGNSADSNQVSGVPIAPPTGLAATAGNRQVALSWTGSAGATSYHVKRSLSSDMSSPATLSATSTTYTDSGLANSTTYYYQVTAVNASAESGPSNTANATPNGPLAPTGLVASPLNAEVDLVWNSVISATSYKVYRSTSSNMSSPTVATASSTSYNDTGLTNNATYYYQVTAVNSIGESDFSNEVSATPIAPPASPFLDGTPGRHMAFLNWTSVPTATQYTLKRGTASGGPYSNVYQGAQTSYIDQPLAAGKTYYYVVVASNPSGNSANSNEAWVTPTSLNNPQIVRGTTASFPRTGSEWPFTTLWDSVSPNGSVAGSDASPNGWLVNYSRQSDLITVTVPSNASLGADYKARYVKPATDPLLVKGGSGNPSANKVNPFDTGHGTSGSTGASGLFDVVDVFSPTGLTATVGSHQLALIWNSVSGATSYTLYRSITTGGPYTSVCSGSATSFTDAGLTDYQTYFYVVTASSSAGTSPYSDEFHATPQPTPATGSQGHEFWLGFINDADTQNADGAGAMLPHNLLLNISSDFGANGTVSVPGLGFSTTFSIGPSQTTTVTVPSGAMMDGHDTVASLGVHVVADNYIAVNAVNNQLYNNNSFTALPVDALGTDYVVAAWSTGYWEGESYGNQRYTPYTTLNLRSELAVVATVDNTTVTIIPSVGAGSDNAQPHDNPNHPAKVPYTVVLNAGQTYHLRAPVSYSDLTGAIVTADRPIAVYGGGQAAQIPVDVMSENSIGQQMIPSDRLDTEYYTIGLSTRSADLIRVLAAMNDTQVTLNGAVVATLQRGDHYDASLSGVNHIQATKPVQVVQYSYSCGFDSVWASDPAMTLVPGVNQQTMRSVWTTSTEMSMASNFVNLLMPTVSTSSLLLDGAAPSGATFNQVTGTSWSNASLSVLPGIHGLSVPGGVPLSAYVYGFDWYDAYAMPASTLLPSNGFSFTPPSAPTNLVATGVSATEIDLAWQDNSSNETGFRIERRPFGTSAWQQVSTVGANSNSYQDLGLVPGWYVYRVYAYNSLNSAYSNEAVAAPLGSAQSQIVGPVGPPVFVLAIASGTNSINVYWNPSCGADSYNVYRTNTPGVYTTPVAANIMPTAGNQQMQSVVDSGLTEGVVYYYAVTANYGGTESAFSPEDGHYPNAEAMPLNGSASEIISWAYGEEPSDADIMVDPSQIRVLLPDNRIVNGATGQIVQNDQPQWLAITDQPRRDMLGAQFTAFSAADSRRVRATAYPTTASYTYEGSDPYNPIYWPSSSTLIDYKPDDYLNTTKFIPASQSVNSEACSVYVGFQVLTHTASDPFWPVLVNTDPNGTAVRLANCESGFQINHYGQPPLHPTNRFRWTPYFAYTWSNGPPVNGSRFEVHGSMVNFDVTDIYADSASPSYPYGQVFNLTSTFKEHGKAVESLVTTPEGKGSFLIGTHTFKVTVPQNGMNAIVLAKFANGLDQTEDPALWAPPAFSREQADIYFKLGHMATSSRCVLDWDVASLSLAANSTDALAQAAWPQSWLSHRTGYASMTTPLGQYIHLQMSNP